MGRGARFTVVHRGADAPTGPRPDRGNEVADGRAWIDPGGPGSGGVEVRLPAGAAGSGGNPVAIDCTAACTVEAPAGGVTVTTGTGGEAHAAPPVADEGGTPDPARGAGGDLADDGADKCQPDAHPGGGEEGGEGGRRVGGGGGKRGGGAARGGGPPAGAGRREPRPPVVSDARPGPPGGCAAAQSRSGPTTIRPSGDS